MTSKFKRTENHNLTITTNTRHHVEFFHSLTFVFIFHKRPKVPITSNVSNVYAAITILSKLLFLK